MTDCKVIKLLYAHILKSSTQKLCAQYNKKTLLAQQQSARLSQSMCVMYHGPQLTYDRYVPMRLLQVLCHELPGAPQTGCDIL